MKRRKRGGSKIRKPKKLTSAVLKDRILTLYQKNPKDRFSTKQIIKKLKLTNTKDSVNHVIDHLIKNGNLKEIKEGRYKLASFKGMKTFKGVVDMTKSGNAYVITPEHDQDIFVIKKRVNFALDGDEVEVLMRGQSKGKTEGEIVKILKRHNDFFVGTFQQNKGFGFVVPSNEKIFFDFYIREEDKNGAMDGDKVIIRVSKWPKPGDKADMNPFAKVTALLKDMDPHELSMQSILVNNGFQEEFPEAVQIAAEKLEADFSEEGLRNRRDFRKITTFTIDPDTAKDFDDALSVEYLENGNIEVGVHIADVTHYVKPDSVIDKEAFKRSTSVYLVDRVAPMLPEKLSNELCSLRPDENSLTFSASFEFDQNFGVVNRWFGKAVIHSDRRFAYEEAQELLNENNTGQPFKKELDSLFHIYKTLRERRFKKGSVDFDSEELKIVLDEDNKPIKVVPRERLDAHMLIEEFMLLANREVAEYMQRKGKGNEIPFVYRVHDLPDETKMADFAVFLKEFGFQFYYDAPGAVRSSINRLTEEARKNDILKLIQPNAIRIMAKAVYTTDNIGHFGLGFEDYTHFTSPIRRYSDVLVHRILEANLGEKVKRFDKNRLEEECAHISNQERKAQEAERESIKYKLVEYMAQFIGHEFDGIISGMIDKGLFVKIIENGSEGLIAFPIDGEDFNIEENRLSATGKISQQVIHLGQKVRVKVLETNLDLKQIEMEIIEIKDLPEKS